MGLHPRPVVGFAACRPSDLIARSNGEELVNQIASFETRRPHRELTLRGYVRLRLGNAVGARALLKEMFVRSFTARTLRDFWRYWNPVYGYFLLKYIYGPLRRILPSSLSAVLTFAFSGLFLHDIVGGWFVASLAQGILRPPVVTMWFVLLAITMLLGESVGLHFNRISSVGRVGIHTGILTVTFAMSYVIASNLAFRIT